MTTTVKAVAAITSSSESVPGTVLSVSTFINSFYHLMISLNQFTSGKRSKMWNLGKGDES